MLNPAVKMYAFCVSLYVCLYLLFGCGSYFLVQPYQSPYANLNDSDNELSHMGTSMLVLFSNKKQINRKIMIF